ncbi:MAG: GNAT family N-acetyltransferase [Burkholderiales bacterium]|nr:GNAT family N-acetyltransferase [Burkholderiales bacterium]
MRVRLLAESDLPALFAVNSDEAVTSMLPYATWQTPADAEAWFGRMAALQATGLALQFVVAEKASDRAIGTCLLFRLEEGSQRAELGYVLGRAHWGRGLMHEALGALLDSAFGPLGLRRLEAEVDPRNLASARVLQRLGFTREGLLRQRWVTKGAAKDVEIHGLLRSEWPATRVSSPKA